ncbi:MAG: DNA polymerase III, partial [Treponemataceae bacterium]|nr:DNA polymerase III [Treponemataceae bacterium]
MYENVLFQNAVPLLERDIKSGRLPRAILFSGGECCGKLTTALETARVISCAARSQGKTFGQWNCSCPSCQKHRAL